MRMQVLGQSSQNRNSSGRLSQHQIMLCVLSPFFRGQMFLCNFRFVVFIMRSKYALVDLSSLNILEKNKALACLKVRCEF